MSRSRAFKKLFACPDDSFCFLEPRCSFIARSILAAGQPFALYFFRSRASSSGDAFAGGTSSHEHPPTIIQDSLSEEGKDRSTLGLVQGSEPRPEPSRACSSADESLTPTVT